MNRLALAPLTLALALAATGCDRDPPLTREEASEALVEVQISTEASGLTRDMVGLTTDFTIGDAAESAAANLRDFVRSQIPCADVTVADRTVTIDFGAMGTCPWRGRSWSGQTAVTIEEVGAEIEVAHAWTGLSDGFVTIDGEATVTWNLDRLDRHVVHRMQWTDGEHVGSSAGDRMQSLLESGDGVRIDGERTWTGRQGRTWALDIDAVEIRALDPVPQAGVYTLEHPAGKTASMTFERIDDTTIRVIIDNGRRDFRFDVRSLR